jgi:phospholipase C
MGTDRLPQIQHIVILMMENHSYDNYLGMLDDRGDGLPRDAEGVPTSTNLSGNGTPIRMQHFAGTRQKGDVPTQSWNATHIQWNEGKCDGFVRSIEITRPGLDASVAMTYWDEKDLPFYYGLASTFPVAPARLRSPHRNRRGLRSRSQPTGQQVSAHRAAGLSAPCGARCG